MTTLVTGATGLVGNNLIRCLLDQGESVRTLTRLTSNSRALDGLDIERHHGDVCDAAVVKAACEGVSYVLHCAARVHIGRRDLKLQRDVNVGGTRNVAVAARENNAKMVHVSSVDALGAAASQNDVADENSPTSHKPLCTYVITKREAEGVIDEQIELGLQASVVNPTYMFGPWDWKPSSGRMLLEVARRWTPIAPAGGVSVVDVRDVAMGILAARQGAIGRRYILAGENMTYFDLWGMLAEVSGTRGPWSRMRWPAKFLAGRFGDLWAMTTGAEPDINSASIAMANHWGYYTSSRAQSELGYHARPARDAVEAAWQWFVAHGYIEVARPRHIPARSASK